MNYLYILKNNKNKYYIGITSLSPEKRLFRHNSGDVFSTKFNKPWEIIHIESFKTLGQARYREKLIKNWHGSNAFKKLIAKAAGSSNGRTSPFEGEYLGPNPSPAALAISNKSGGVK